MKKFKTILTMFVCVLCSFIFAACGDDPGLKPKQYNITLETSTEYELSSNRTKAEAFDQITITVTLKTADKKLVGIKYGNETVSQNRNGTFTFFMPTSDVTVSAILEDYVEVLASDSSSRPFVSFNKSNTKTIVPNTGIVTLKTTINGSYMTILRKNISSSNTTSIPENAIEIKKETESSGNLIIGADINIDTSKVSLGYSWIEINFANGNVSSQTGKLVFKLTVANEISVETWKENLVFDISSLSNVYKNEVFTVWLTDSNHVKGMTSESHHVFENLSAENNKIKITFDYTLNHNYYVDLYIKDKEDPDLITWFKFDETISGGNSVTGFNQYKNNLLSFVTENFTLTIRVNGVLR